MTTPELTLQLENYHIERNFHLLIPPSAVHPSPPLPSAHCGGTILNLVFLFILDFKYFYHTDMHANKLMISFHCF